MNFPSSPTLNQEYSFGSKSWRWDGTAWQIISVSTTEAVAAAASANAAATSASNASTSASNAASSATAAASSATAAAASAASINDASLVHKTGDETIAGTKTFSSPVSGSVTGTAANVTGTVAVANGGTGATTAAGARTNLGLGGDATGTNLSALTNAATARSNLGLAIGTDVQAYSPVLSSYAATGIGFRNRIINGDMRIAQRNAGASVTQSTAVAFPVDRWAIYGNVASKFSAQQNAGAVTPPAGFSNYLGITSLSSYSVGTSDEFNVSQPIEGYNVADLGFGAAGAQSVTLSFWVRSSLTGTFGGALQSTGAGRSYPFSYTISAANTWEQKTITVAGDTTGTWNKTNGNGLAVYFGMGQGSSKSAAAGSWVSGNYNNAAGATSVVGTAGATFYITGVQLEAGTVATPFERRDYGRELMMCQRYYEVIALSAEALIAYYTSGNGGSFKFQSYNFAVTKRTAPTIPNATASGQWVVSGVVAVSANTSHTFQASASTTSSFGGLCVRQVGGSAPNLSNAYNWEQSVTFTASAEL